MSIINVLDHGFVRLVDSMGSDLSVARAARVSFDAAWRATKGDDKLIYYLWEHKHTTPFEAVTFTFEVYAPIFVLRQWHRHRTWSYNELSARYKEVPEKFYIPDPDKVGTQSEINKQGRVGTKYGAITKRKAEVNLLEVECNRAFATYSKLLKVGWPRELARSILPINTYSKMFATVNLLNLLKFLDLRRDHHAQYEIRAYAEALEALANKVVPVCMGAASIVGSMR